MACKGLLAALIVVPHLACAQLSLQPARTFDATLAEGTWMQPDLAPNGRSILFDLLGDIYSVDIGGGVARPVLAGVPFETHPVHSPDGKSIAFISDRSGVTNLWIANTDGSSPRALSTETDLTVFTSPAWTPDGRAVYVSRMKHPVLAFELWKFNLDGGEPSVIVRAQPNGEDWDTRINAVGVAASSDDKYLYYAKKLGHTWTEKHPPQWSIVRHDLQTNTPTTIVEGAGGAMQPVLSHDNKRLVYASRDGAQTRLRMRTLDSGEDRWLTSSIDHDAQEQGYYDGLLPRYSFAPDDRSLIASVGGKLVRIDAESGDTVPIEFMAHAQVGLGPLARTQQTKETGPVRVRVNLTPRQSPDGKRIAFTALGTLYIQDLRAGAKPRAVAGAPSHAFQPRWSPDGRRLVFITWDAVQGGAIWSASASGGDAHKLTSTLAFYTEPTYSPGGATIVALRASHYDRLRTLSEIAPDRVTDVIRLPASGGEPTTILQTAGARLLAFTSDPARVRFYGPAGASSVGLDGKDLKRELVVRAKSPSQYVGVPIPVEELLLSPDGKKALARTASQLHLLEVPAAADGKPADIDLTQNPGTRLTRVGADFVDWSPDGQAITWSVGSTFRRIALDRVVATAGATEARAQSFTATVAVPRDVPTGALVLRGAKVVTMRGDEIIPSADIVVVGNRIAAIGAEGTVRVPKQATIRDVRGKFIVPGFVDAHAHWFEIRRQVHDDQMWNVLAALAFGVTSSLDPQPFTTDIFAYQDMIDAGLMLGPRLWSTGPGVFNNSGITSKAAASDVLTRYRDFYRTRNIKSYMVGDRERRQFMTAAAHELGMLPTTEGASDLNLNLTHAIDGFAGNEHSIPVTPLRADVVGLLATSRMSLVPTLSVLYGGEPALSNLIIERQPQKDTKFAHFVPSNVIDGKLRDRRWLPRDLETYARFANDALEVQRRGGLVGVGSHGEMQGLGFHWELELLASGGTPLEALRAATLGSAETIGHVNDVGSLEVGKFADLLILDADPTANIRNTQSLRWVMKNGRLYDAATLNELWPRERALPRLWHRL